MKNLLRPIFCEVQGKNIKAFQSVVSKRIRTQIFGWDFILEEELRLILNVVQSSVDWERIGL